VRALRAPHAFDGDRFLPGGATVFVDDGRFLGVEAARCEIPTDCDLAVYDDATLLPGLIDTHVHLVGDSQDGALERVTDYSQADLDRVIDDGLHRQLAAGVTTVRDLGDRAWCVVDRRDRQDRCTQEPTIVASGPPVTVPGGHCHFMGGAVEGAAAMAAAVEERVQRRVDVLKVMASGGFTTPGTAVDKPQFSDTDLRRLVDLAHDAGLPVVAHAHALAAVEQALNIGVEGIEHCSCITKDGFSFRPELFEHMATNETLVSITMGQDQAKIGSPPPHIAAMFAEHGWTLERMLTDRTRMQEQICATDILLHCGTDAGINRAKPHGILPLSVLQHVERGRTLTVALQGATSLAARACGLHDTKGHLRPHFDADLLVVSGDLEQDVHALTRPLAVLLHGTTVSIAGQAHQT
jgi:imidazolonepropionase-like amidohydrolase